MTLIPSFRQSTRGRRPARRPLVVELLEDRTVLTAVAPPSGLISWWPGDGSAADLVGSNPGTPLNGTTFATGQVGQAFSFDGNNDLVDVGGSYAVAGARTIEAWVFSHANTGLGLPILTGGVPGRGDFFGVAGTTGTNNGTSQYNLYVDHWGVPTYHSTATLTPEAWNHIALTYDGSTLRFYINGQSGGSVTGSLYDYDLNTCDIGGNRIGGTTTKASMNGLLDEVTVYNRTLSATEIQSIYAAGTDGKNKFFVRGGSPADGQTISAPPTEFVLDLSKAHNGGVVQASKFTVNGIAADSVVLTDTDTVTFHYDASPVTAQGPWTMYLDEGAVVASTGEAVAGWSATFRYDVVPMQVTSATPTAGGTITLPPATVQLTFNEAVDTASVGTNDLTLSQGTVTGFSVSGDGTSVTYTLGGLGEGGAIAPFPAITRFS